MKQVSDCHGAATQVRGGLVQWRQCAECGRPCERIPDEREWRADHALIREIGTRAFLTLQDENGELDTTPQDYMSRLADRFRNQQGTTHVHPRGPA